VGEMNILKMIIIVNTITGQSTQPARLNYLSMLITSP